MHESRSIVYIRVACWYSLVAATLLCLFLTGCGDSAAQIEPAVQPVVAVTPLPTQDTVATEATLAERAIPTPTPSVYVIQSGDTLFAIATRFGTTVGEITALNGITDPNQIRQGQQLLIPAPSRPLPLLTATPTP